jgi:uncharacterized membrane protein
VLQHRDVSHMSAGSRLGFVDWLRGLAVLLMMQTHVFDAWLAPAERSRAWFGWSRLLGGAPAPLFLFLAGLGLALAAERRRGRAPGRAVVREGVSRGLEVVGYAALFRLWMFATGGFTRPADLLRVDVLNCIGLSMALASLAALAWPLPRWRIASALALAAGLAVLTPIAWAAAWPKWIPTALVAYVDGRTPFSLFPLLPWAGFTAVGVAAGLALARARASAREARTLAWMTALGAAAVPVALALDARTRPLALPYDFWRTSPSFFLLRSGLLLVLLGLAFLWARAPWARGPSPLRQLGRTSLLVYWLHVEVVYGVMSLGFRHRLGSLEAALGLGVVTLMMLLISLLRTGALRMEGRREVVAGAA